LTKKDSIIEVREDAPAAKYTINGGRQPRRTSLIIPAMSSLSHFFSRLRAMPFLPKIFITISYESIDEQASWIITKKLIRVLSDFSFAAPNKKCPTSHLLEPGICNAMSL